MKTTLTALMALGMALGVQAQVTNTIQFDPPSLPGGSPFLPSWTESGFRFSASGGLSHTDSGGSTGRPDSGSAYLNAFGDMLIKRYQAVTPCETEFSVKAVDLAEYSVLFAEPMDVTFTGHRADGSTVSQTFRLDGVMDGTGPLEDFETFHFSEAFTNLVLLVGSRGSWNMDNLVVVTEPERRSLGDGLVSWWKAEDNTLDSWGTNHGSATAKFEPGKVGQCFTAASQTRIPDSKSLQLTNALTLEAWVNPDAKPTPNGSVVSKFEFAPFSQRRAAAYFLGVGYGNYLNGPVFMLTPTGYESNAVRLAPFTNLPYAQWSHLAATYDGAVMRLYLNGGLVGQTNFNGGIWPGTNDLCIGATAVTGLGRTYGSFNGRIDEASIYNRALSEEEVAAIYRADSAGKDIVVPDCESDCTKSPGGLVSWWTGDGNLLDATRGADLIWFNPSFATGMVDRAFSFVRSRAPAFAPTTDALNFGSNVNFSIEMWIKPDPSLSANTSLVEKRDFWSLVGDDYTGLGYSLFIRDGRLGFWMSPNLLPSNAIPFLSTNPNLLDGQYHHVGVTVERNATNGGKLFVDGNVVLTFDPTARNGRLISSSAVYLGGGNQLSGGLYAGQMDEAAIYNRALAPAEMLKNWQDGATGRCKTPPFLVLQPASRWAAPNVPVTLNVVAGGWEPQGYQWFRNGQPIQFATGESFWFIPQVGQVDSYSVRVTNVFGSAMSSNAVIQLNLPPTAVAEVFPRFLLHNQDPEIRIIATNGLACTVFFSAGQSSDGNGDPLSFDWQADGETFGTNLLATNSLAVGEHALKLIVSDGKVSVTNAFALQVITGAEAIRLFQGQIAGPDLPHGRIQPLEAMLNNAIHQFEMGHEMIGLHHLQTVQARIRDWIEPSNSPLAKRLQWIAQQIVDAFSLEDVPGTHASRIEWRGQGRHALCFEGKRGRAYVIESSSDLARWEAVGIATEGESGHFEYLFRTDGNEPARFYRIKAP